MRTRPKQPDIRRPLRIAMTLNIATLEKLSRRFRCSLPTLSRVSHGTKTSRRLRRRVVRFVLARYGEHGIPLTPEIRKAARLVGIAVQ